MDKFPDKQPKELLDYDFNYAEWLVDGDFLSDAEVTIEDLSSSYKLTMRTKGVKLEDLLSGNASGDYSISGCIGNPFPRAIISFFVVAEEYVKVWISDGDDKEKYKITCTAEAHSGRIKESEGSLKIKEK